MGETTDKIEIYVACLASYNNGILHGAWIDANQDVGSIHDEIRAMLQASPMRGAEEYAIHDTQGFERVAISEYQSIETVVEIAGFISEHGMVGAKLMEHYNNIEDAKTSMEGHYAGVYASLAEFAEEITEATTEIPNSLSFYIDYERMAHDLEINDIIAFETNFEEIHVFWSH